MYFTRGLLDDLKILLGDTTPNPIALPVLPAPAPTERYVGDDRDAACFRCEAVSGGWQLAGPHGRWDKSDGTGAANDLSGPAGPLHDRKSF